MRKGGTVIMSLIEIVQIIVQIFFIFFIFSCTILLYENNKIFGKRIFFEFDKIIINYIILINIFVFTSVLNISQKYILIVYIIIFIPIACYASRITLTAIISTGIIISGITVTRCSRLTSILRRITI